jgi:hypothetical protein
MFKEIYSEFVELAVGRGQEEGTLLVQLAEDQVWEWSEPRCMLADGAEPTPSKCRLPPGGPP